MKYIITKDNTITCEHVGNCGSCRVKEHSHHDCMPGDSLAGESGLLYCIGCGEPARTIREGVQLKTHGIHEECRKLKATSIATRFGGIDGDHHKQWVIDQMLQTILGPQEYSNWVERMNSDPEYDPWDQGTPP